MRNIHNDRKGIRLCTLALLGLLFVACDDDDTEVSVPTPELTATSVVSASADGGQYSFTYSVTNPAEDADIYFSEDVSWISDIVPSADGAVRFNVTMNSDEAIRSGNVIITYTYDGGYNVKNVVVIQDGYAVPELTVQPAAVTPEYYGGEYSFTYAVTNTKTEGHLECGSDADWIGNFDYSTYGTVSFTVDANYVDEIRSAEIAVSYIYPEGAVSRTIAVVQSHSDVAPEVHDIIGTYEATGLAYYSAAYATEQTWTLKIYADTGYKVYIDGLTPVYSGIYDQYGDHRCSARGYLDEDGRIIIPTQIIGTTTVTTSDNYVYYFGYMPCVEYVEGEGFSFMYSYPNFVFEYNESEGTWTSNYGMFAGGFNTLVFSSFAVFFDVTCPSTTIRKTSSDTGAASLSSVAADPDVSHNISAEALPAGNIIAR